MLLCIDIGNTNMVIGLWNEGNWLAQWRVRTAHDKMPDEYAVLLKTLLRDRDYELENVTRVAIASVVPHLKTVFQDLFNSYLGVKPLILGPGVHTGISIRIDNPAELGADLVADAVAAYERLHTTCIIVDFGTATTFSAVSEDGEFLGVSIAPGIEVAAEALARQTAQLPHIRLIPPTKVIGKNTTHSMQSGLIFGYIGLVEGLIRRIRIELGGKAVVIATGGLSKVFAPLTDEITIIDQELTLEGLRIISERNMG
ncbi:MAG: type III pantothenate kinase [Spirochaetes bacterium]|nr:type III pantothenate kinase [Spirochaetota bacterium]